jgi:hypothetical protein
MSTIRNYMTEGGMICLVLPAQANVLDIDSVADMTGSYDHNKILTLVDEGNRNKFNTGSSVADLSTGKSVKLANVDHDGTNKNIYTEAEWNT